MATHPRKTLGNRLVIDNYSAFARFRLFDDYARQISSIQEKISERKNISNFDESKTKELLFGLIGADSSVAVRKNSALADQNKRTKRRERETKERRDKKEKQENEETRKTF